MSCSLYKNIDVPFFNNEADNYIYVINEIEYKIDPVGWKYPHETVYLGYGDCSDKSGLLAYMFKHNMKYEDVLIYPCIIKENGKGHMIVKANGIFYESTSLKIYNNPEKYLILGSPLSLETYIKIADLIHIVD